MAWWSEFAACIQQSEPLAGHTWFGIGGPAELFAQPRNVDELAALVRAARQAGAPVHLLGGGSNLLVGDAGVGGLVVSLTQPKFGEITVEGDRVRAGAGAKLGQVISAAVREGLSGLETLVGIPGTIGGALKGNAGGRGGDIGQRTVSVTVLTDSGEIQQRSQQELVFGYRESNLDDLAILAAEFRLEPDDPIALTKRMQKQWIIKKAEQPLGHQSAGCIFKNPRGMSAGALIEQAGLKGQRCGKAEVSTRHANFIVTDPGATSQDVKQLIEQIRHRVKDRLGVDLELEIQIW